MAKKKKQGAATACGRAYWLWVSDKKNQVGFWLPLTPHECGAKCSPAKPIRDGRHRFEVVSKACAGAVKRMRSGSLECGGECEWVAVMVNGQLKWVGNNMCSQDCECGPEPPYTPSSLGEVFLDFCVKATAATGTLKKQGGKAKAAKSKARKGVSRKKK